jgi:hypothetical protein
MGPPTPCTDKETTMQTNHGRDAVQLARRTYALVLAGGRGSRLMQLPTGAPSRRSTSAASSASSISRCRTA